MPFSGETVRYPSDEGVLCIAKALTANGLWIIVELLLTAEMLAVVFEFPTKGAIRDMRK